jgi:glycosyltransferase involved in cell wall biosynthesis
MRVLHLNTHASGGSYEYAALLCTALAEQGIESRVLSKNSQQLNDRRPFLDRVIRRLYVSLSTEPWHGTRRLLSPPAGGQLDGIDVVHLHTVADWFNVPRWLETLPGTIGVVISLHDVWHFTGGCFLYRGCNLFSDTCAPCPILKSPFDRILAKDEQRRKLQGYRDRRVQFVANSHWLANLAERSLIVRTCGGARVITPGIDTAVFRPENKAICRAEFAIPQDAFVIAAGAASLADKNKNVQWLLEQLARLSGLDNVVVLLVGEGALRIPVGLNVRSVGGTPDRAKRAKLFGAADIFVSASLMETYGLTLVEAMACGTPVVAFRVGGIPDAAPDGEGAILCAPQDASALIEAIIKLRDSNQLRERLGNAGRKTVRLRNGLYSFAEAFIQIYEECVRHLKTRSATRSASHDKD